MNRREILALLVLAAVAITLDTPGLRADCFADTDAAVHAMDGVFFADLARDHPSPAHWKEYAIEYFARYPSLGLVIYPPLYPFALAPFTAVFGISAAVARGVVLLFALANLLAFYFLVRRGADARAALVASAFLVTNMEVIRWSREAMLEIPALLFMNLAALFWLEFIDGDRRRAAPAAGLALALAIYAKQPAGFLLAPLACFGLLRRGRAFLADRRAWIALLLFALVVAPLAIVTMKFGNYGTVQLTPETYGYAMNTVEYWTAWLHQLPTAFHPGVLALAIAGAVLGLRARHRPLVQLLLLWFAWWYLTFSYLPIKTIRFATFVAPAVAALAGIAVAAWDALPIRLAAAALLALLFAAGVREPVPFIDGYDDAAAFCAARSDGRPVLFDGYHSANFVYHMRRAMGDRKAIVLRGSKMITSTASGALASYPMITTETGLAAILDRYAVARVVVEDNVAPELSLPHTAWLREYLRHGPFTLEATIPVESNIAAFTGKKLLVYRYDNAPSAPADGTLEIFVPSAGMTIRVRIP